MFENIAPVHLQLNADASSVHSHRGNRQLGLLCLTLQGYVFNTLSNLRFVPPVNPGQHPFIPEGSTGPAAASVSKEHEDKSKEFKIYD